MARCFPHRLQRAEVRCSIETLRIEGRPHVLREGCSARKCAALLRPGWPVARATTSGRCSARKCAALLRLERLAPRATSQDPVAARGSALLY